jgi:hypothetical protein
LASAHGNNNIMIWDIPGKAPNKNGGDNDNPMKAHWDDLLSSNGRRVHAAIWSSVRRSSAAVTFLRHEVRPVPSVDANRLARLLDELDSSSFQTRQQATRELAKVGEATEQPLTRLVNGSPSLEVASRAKNLLKELRLKNASPEKMRTLRAIETLEYMGTPDAGKLLQELSQGAPGARTTREASAAWERVQKRNE